MGYDPDPQEARQAPENRELTWACVSSNPYQYAFYADRDVTHAPDTVCVRLDRLETTAKAAWYITRSLRELRTKALQLFPHLSVEQDASHDELA